MRIALAATLLTAGLISACSPSQPEREGSTNIARYTEARGGEVAIEAQNSIRVRVQVTEPTFTVEGDYRATRDGLMRIDIYADGERVFTEALDGAGGWQMFGNGDVADLSEEGRRALETGIAGNLFGLHEFTGLGHMVRDGEILTIDGMDYPTIDIIYEGGREERLYLDPETWLAVRQRSEYALHPDVDPEQEIFETRYSDFRDVNGVMRAFHTERINLRTGEVAQETQILSIEINPDLDPAQFQRPE
jgi:hypothetical protein